MLLVLTGLAVAVLVAPTPGKLNPRVEAREGTPETWVCFLPLVRHGHSNPVQQTLGPSPTPTRTPTPRPPTTTPTWGPTLTPSVTPIEPFLIEQAVTPLVGNIGTQYVFTLGLRNRQAVPVQVTLVEALPDGLLLDRVWPPLGTVLLIGDDVFTATLTVAANWTDNLMFSAIGGVPPCMNSCYTQNDVPWEASWPGGSTTGTASSLRILLLNYTPTPTPLMTLTPTPIWPTVVRTATPGATTPGASPTATPTASRTPVPTLGPSPTPTP